MKCAVNLLPNYLCFGMVGCLPNIIVTQPRKLAAVSVCRRVCEEQNWIPGKICGYQVRHRLLEKMIHIVKVFWIDLLQNLLRGQ